MKTEYVTIKRVSTEKFLRMLERLTPTPPIRTISVGLNDRDFCALQQICYSSGLTPEQIVRDMLLDYRENATYKLPKEVPEPTTKALRERIKSEIF